MGTFKANIKPKPKFKANINYRPKFKANIVPPPAPPPPPPPPPKPTFKANIVPKKIIEPILTDIAELHPAPQPSDTPYSIIVGGEEFQLRIASSPDAAGTIASWHTTKNAENSHLTVTALFRAMDAAQGTSIYRSCSAPRSDIVNIIAQYITLSQYQKLLAHICVANMDTSKITWESEEFDILFQRFCDNPAYFNKYSTVYDHYRAALEHFGINKRPSQLMYYYGIIGRPTTQKVYQSIDPSAAYCFSCDYTESEAIFHFSPHNNIRERFEKAINRLHELVVMNKTPRITTTTIGLAKTSFYFHNNLYIKMPPGSDKLLTQTLEEYARNIFADPEDLYPFADVTVGMPPTEYTRVTIPFYAADDALTRRTKEINSHAIRQLALNPDLIPLDDTPIRRATLIKAGLGSHEVNRLRQIKLIVPAEQMTTFTNRFGEKETSLQPIYGHYTLSPLLLEEIAAERRLDE